MNESEAKLLSFRPTCKFSTIISDIKLKEHLLTPEKSVIYLGIKIDETLSINKETEFLHKDLLEQTESYQNFNITHLLKS